MTQVQLIQLNNKQDRLNSISIYFVMDNVEDLFPNVKGSNNMMCFIIDDTAFTLKIGRSPESL